MVNLIIGGTKSLHMQGTIFSILSKLQLIQKSNGLPGLVIYLKVCSIILQQYTGGYHLHDISPLGMRISRRGNLPSIICNSHRQLIRNKNLKSAVYIRFYLTIFALYRDFIVPCKVKLNTITDDGPKSILLPPKVYIQTFIRLFIPSRIFINRWSFIRNFTDWLPCLKSGPTTSSVQTELGLGNFNGHPIALLKAAINLKYTGLLPTLFKFGTYLDESFNLTLNMCRLITSPGEDKIGKLGFKVEAAGKLRVFAMVDQWTQWAMAPLHRFIFKILKNIPMDGTFNQLKPLKKAINWPSWYSLDLSAATDRMPIRLQRILIKYIFNNQFASYWAKLLVDRNYWITDTKFAPKQSLRYKVGQPMGALSSWGMLALTHHFIVQWAAWEAGYPKHRLFTKYALLGDDLVLGCPKVKKSYLSLLNSLGMTVGLHKSILSPSATGLEFAKKTMIQINGSIIDCSPLPIAEMREALLSGAGFVEYCKKYKLNLWSSLRLAGLGHKSVCRSKKLDFTKLPHLTKFLILSQIPTKEMTWKSLSIAAPYSDIKVMSRISVDMLSPWKNRLERKIRTLELTLSKLPSRSNLGVHLGDMPHLFDTIYGGQLANVFDFIGCNLMQRALVKSQRNNLLTCKYMLGSIRPSFTLYSTWDSDLQVLLRVESMLMAIPTDVLLGQVSRTPTRRRDQLSSKQIKLWARTNLLIRKIVYNM